MLGRLADEAGWGERELDVEAPTVAELAGELGTHDPGLAERLLSPRVTIAVNGRQVRGDAPLTPTDEVAFMPPVSGG